MAKSPFSQNWYRVSDLTPRLRSHATIHRQRFRGDTWYILQDNQSGRYHRISPSANLMLNLMDGRRTVRDIWQAVADRAHAHDHVQPRADLRRVIRVGGQVDCWLGRV